MPKLRASSICLLGLFIACTLPPTARAADLDGPSQLPAAVQRAAAAVTPALVRIHVVEVDYSAGREVKSEATGSGVILTDQGYVVTNHHVAGNASQILCTFADKEELDAELVGTDPLTDICVLKLLPKQPRSFPVANFGDSSALKVGDPVLAMGSPLALSQSVTMGIVSNTELVMPDLLWRFRVEVEGEDVGSIVKWIGHDARISGGNSGGPLVNLAGEVVGINEISFGLAGAIPGNLARDVAHHLIEHGKVVRAWIGLEVQPLLKSAPERAGVLVSGAIPGSPADDAGFQPGDLLLSLHGGPVTVRVPEELPIFNLLVADLPVASEVEATVFRDGAEQALLITPREREPSRPKEREFPEWGITGRNLSFIETRERRRQTRDGIIVTSTRPGGPADGAKPKIVWGDIIVGVAGAPVNRVAELVEATARALEGRTERVPVLVSYDRRGTNYLTAVKLGHQPLPDPAREARKAWLGVAVQVLTRDLADALDLAGKTGVRITQVFPDAPAHRAALQVGDILIALDGQSIPAFRPEHSEIFLTMIRQYKIGAEVEFTLIRAGETHKLIAQLGESPKAPREMAKYRDDSFEFTVRDVTLADLARQRWQERQQGPLIQAVSEGSWAALGHLSVGDYLLAVDGRPTPDVAAVEEAMARIVDHRPAAVVFRVRRGIHILFIELRPKWPDLD